MKKDWSKDEEEEEEEVEVNIKRLKSNISIYYYYTYATIYQLKYNGAFSLNLAFKHR